MKLFRVLSLGCLFAALVSSQGASKRPLTHRDYDSWKSIAGQQLSRDGKFLAYSVFPQEGDGELVVRDLAAEKDWRFAAGAIPPAPDTENEENPEAPPPVRGIRIAFSGDGKYVIATTFPPKAETDKARKERRRPDQMPRGGLLIVELGSGKETRIADVASMQVPEDQGGWVAYKKGPKPGEPAPAESKPAADAADQRGAPRPGGAGGRPEYGTDLVLRHLATGAERTFADASEFLVAKDGGALLYTVSSRQEETNGLYLVDPAADAPPRALLSGKGRYTRPVWDRTERQIVFLSNKDNGRKFKAYRWQRGAGQPVELSDGAGLSPGFEFAERGPVGFSRDGARIYLAAAPAGRAERPAAPAPDPGDERVLADLWHWKDDYIQPMQKVRSAQERSRTYRAVFHLADNKLVQVADPTLQTVNFSDDGRWALGSDDRKYRSMVDYDGNYADLYLVDTANGTRKPLIEKFRGNAIWSPKGTYALAFKKGDWWSLRIADGYLTNLTAGLGTRFFNEEHDSPSEPGAYGNAGWTKDGDGVLLYDQYDVWYVAADGRASRRLTQGREQKTQFRVMRLDGRGGGFGPFGGGGRGPGEEEDEERGLDPAKTLYLRAEHLITRDTGFYALGNLTGAAPVKLLMGAKNFRTAGKARNADVVLVSATTFTDEPNLHVTDSSFRSLKQVTEANPQKRGILWGTGELFSFKNADGVPLQAALYKPENFDPKKKYPLMVYIYERLSQNVHNFVRPAPGTSVNFSYYVSNGYLVMTPDIVYSIGSPGQSALKCVLPAVQELVDRGFVDESAIGIQGHSWGGYQISYMVTRTNRFRAAEAGAPVGNMTSAYNGIRWGSGLPRQFQYEKTQSRIGGTLWEAPLDFIENSPVFRAHRVQTPLLILHDDEDDAVPWYQGIELFLSLRRNGKEAYLFNYNGEKHGLRKRHNQKDFTVRMQQFFDHFLKGAPKPEWMEKGIPYNEREEEKKRFHAAAYGEPSGDR
jgi:dipeptidyl aminopeptidase/acylaminoacyl peptidase